MSAFQFEMLASSALNFRYFTCLLDKGHIKNSSVALQKIGQVGDKLQAVGDKVSGVGETLTKSVTAPVVGLGTAAVATAANFESSAMLS